MTDQANAGPKCPTTRVMIVGGGGLHSHQTLAIAELLKKASVEVTVATIEPTYELKRHHKHEPLDDGFAASYLNPVAEKKFRNDRPYLKRKKGRS